MFLQGRVPDKIVNLLGEQAENMREEDLINGMRVSTDIINDYSCKRDYDITGKTMHKIRK